MLMTRLILTSAIKIFLFEERLVVQLLCISTVALIIIISKSTLT